MANVFKQTKTVMQPVEVAAYNLELTKAEAIALRLVLSAVGGNPNTSIRKFLTPIGKVLDEIGFDEVTNPNTMDDIYDSRHGAAVYFREGSDVAIEKFLESSNF